MKFFLDGLRTRAAKVNHLDGADNLTLMVVNRHSFINTLRDTV